jgi:hypothetical protein
MGKMKERRKKKERGGRRKNERKRKRSRVKKRRKKRSKKKGRKKESERGNNILKIKTGLTALYIVYKKEKSCLLIKATCKESPYMS